MRFRKRKPHSHRKANGRGWKVVFRQPRTPIGGHAAGPLPLPGTASMRQRTVPLPRIPARTAYPTPAPAEVRESAKRVTAGAAHRPAYEIDPSLPLFRDERTLVEYEDRYRARLRQLQRFGNPWPAGEGVNLGSDQTLQTITFQTIAYRDFAGGPQAGAR